MKNAQQMELSNIDTFALDELKSIMAEDFPLLLDTFFEDSSRKLIEIEAALKIEDAAQLRLVAHSFKGSASNLYATALQMFCYELEQCALNEQLQTAPLIFENLKREYLAVKKSLESYR